MRAIDIGAKVERGAGAELRNVEIAAEVTRDGAKTDFAMRPRDPQPTEELGSSATRHLIGLVEGNIEVKFGMEFIVLRLIIRESCGGRGGVSS